MLNVFPVSEKEIRAGESDKVVPTGQLLSLPYLSLLICLSGKAVVQVNFKKYVCRQGDILVLSEDSITLFLRASDDFRMFYCLVGKVPASEIAYKLPNELFRHLWKSPHFMPDETEWHLLTAWKEQFLYIDKRCETYRCTLLCNLLQAFFLYLSERLQPLFGEEPGERYSRKELLCWKFWDLIGKHCREHRDVAFYARTLCITPFYLSQLTQRFLNESPKGLIERQVVLEIKSLLQSTDIPVKQIADTLHFDDPSYMCRFFKRHTGFSLTAYRGKFFKRKVNS